MNSFFENARKFWDWISSLAGEYTKDMEGLSLSAEEIARYYTFVVRLILPVLAAVIFIRCILPLLRGRKLKQPWAYLIMPDGTKVPLTHWENSIGRSKLSDVVVDFAFLSRSHAVLSFCNKKWTISDLGSKGGTKVNGEKVEMPAKVEYGDVISLAGYEMTLGAPDDEPREEQGSRGDEGILAKVESIGSSIKPGLTLLLILIFQGLGAIQIILAAGSGLKAVVPLSFLAFFGLEVLYYIFMGKWGRKHFETEMLAYFMCGLNLMVVASAAPGSILKQLVAILAGMVVYIVLSFLIRDLGRARKLKYVLSAGAILLLVLNLVIGETRFGAKNWINLGFITFQPLEFVKVAFVIAGTATLDRLLTRQNMTAFIGFSAACICALVLIRDLGTAVVFFGTFIVIAFMRSGDVRTIAFISSGAVLGAIGAISFLPYIASRFATWGHAWEYANSSGYQQTRTMIAAANGGLFGVGGSNGYLSDVAAADTDLVFGLICEEWGLVIGLIVVSIIIFFAIYALLLTKSCRSSFYAIAACGAVSIYLIQTGLNVFGSLDILPLTGVTIPFVSNGGSSMIVSWGLLAFIKAADNRTDRRTSTAKGILMKGAVK